VPSTASDPGWRGRSGQQSAPAMILAALPVVPVQGKRPLPRHGYARRPSSPSRGVGADDDTEPASADVPAADGYINARELIAAQI